MSVSSSRFITEISLCRAHLHSKKLIHRDLKSHNLLVNSLWTCKVADFGISTVRPTITREMTCIGTPVYMAPEVLSKNKYSEKADVYSFGIVLMEIFTGNLPYSQPPFDKMNQAQLMYQILENGCRPVIEGLHPILQHLIEECWSADPHIRPSFPEIVMRLRRLATEFSPENDPNMPISDLEELVLDYPQDLLNHDSLDSSFELLVNTGSTFSSDVSQLSP